MSTERERELGRNRKRRFDERERERKQEEHQAAEERGERMSRNPHFFGEISPKQNAPTCADEVQVHREFLRAMAKPDVQPGETLRGLAERTFEAWLEGPCSFEREYVAAFNRTYQAFDQDHGFNVSGIKFDEAWTPPSDCSGNEPIDIATLPELPALKEIAVSSFLRVSAKPEAAEPIKADPSPFNYHTTRNSTRRSIS